MTERLSPHRLAGHLGWAALLAAALYAGRISTPEGSTLAVVWPAAAVTVVWLLRTRPGAARAAVSVGIAAVVLAVNGLTGVDLHTSLVFGGINAVHGWIGLLVLRRRDWPTSAFLPRVRDAMSLVWASLAAGTASGLLSGLAATWLIGTGLLRSATFVSIRNVLSTAVLGAALLGAPHLLAALRARRVPLTEMAWIVVGGAAAHAVAFRAIGDGHPVAFLLVPVWVWVGARLSAACSALLVAVMAVPLVAAGVVGRGHFAGAGDVAERVLLIQAFLAVSCVVAVGLAVLGEERRGALREARRRSDELEAYLQASLVGFAVLDVASGTLSSANPALSDLLGIPAGELVGSRWRDHVAEPDVPALDTALVALRRGQSTSWHAELGHLTSGGEVRFAQVALAVVPHEGGSVATVQFLDVTERREAERRLSHRVLHDELTGLPNRTMLRDHLELALAQRRRPWLDDVAVLFFDLDRFKAVNDTYGHDAGDTLLVTAASRLATAMRPGDTVARVGGDEFVALCTGLTGADEAAAIAGRVLEAVCRPVQLGDATVVVQMSVGVAVARPGDTASTLLQESDAAMLLAKRQGRGRVVTWDDTVPPPRRPPLVDPVVDLPGPARTPDRAGRS